MNYGLLALMLGVGLLVVAVASIFAVGTAVIAVPSEEKCQSIYGFGTTERAYAERYFCEFNETGWHLNKTRFREAFGKEVTV